jgi:hypothetical protein
MRRFPEIVMHPGIVALLVGSPALAQTRITKPGGVLGWGLEYYLRTFALRTESRAGSSHGHLSASAVDFPLR